MLLYLTSSAHLTLDGLIPSLPKIPAKLKVAFISTAGNLYKEVPWQVQDRNKLIELGFTVEDVDIAICQQDMLRDKLEKSDVIFVAGGNTSYLLEQAQFSGFLEFTKDLVKKGKVYIGSSAGSMLAGPNVEADRVFDEGEFGKVLGSYDALGLVDFIVLPHAQRLEYAPYIERIQREYGNKYEFRKIRDNQAILVKDRNIEAISL